MLPSEDEIVKNFFDICIWQWLECVLRTHSNHCHSKISQIEPQLPLQAHLPVPAYNRDITGEHELTVSPRPTAIAL